MTEAAARQTKPFSVRGIRGMAAAYPEATAIVVYALVAMAATAAAYLAIFVQFAPYDDEGTVLMTLRAFAHGQTLYRDVYSSYGPFYYELLGGLFALSGRAVTTDTGRTIVILLWVATSLLFGVAAQRLTGRLALGVTGMIAAFAALDVLINEPMHPQGLCALILGAFALLAVSWPKRRVGWSGAAAGALLAALLMTKINLGVFAVAATVLAAAWAFRPLQRRGWLRVPVIVAFLAMPTLITARDLNLAWVRELLVLELLSAVAIMIAAHPLRARPGDDDSALGRWLGAAVAGFALGLVAILGAILLTGPSPADVYNGVVTQAIEVRDVLVIQFPFPPAAVDWGIVAVAAATLTTRLRTGPSGKPSIWPGLLRTAAGLTTLLAVAHVVPFGLNPSASNPIVVPMMLAWVAAVPPAGDRESAQRRFLRVLLPALAVAETLQVYPVAGSQVGIAAVVFVPVGALCLADGLSEVRVWASARGGLQPERVAAIAGVAAVALAGMFGLDSIVLPGASNAALYRNQPELPLPGATLLHLPASQVETYTGIVDLLHRHRCTAFVGDPSTDSLYLWSGLEAPTPQLPNAWVDVFDDAQQQRIIDQLRASPRPCAIRSEELAQMYLGGAPASEPPLVHYLFSGARPAGQSGGYQLLLPKPRR